VIPLFFNGFPIDSLPSYTSNDANRNNPIIRNRKRSCHWPPKIMLIKYSMLLYLVMLIIVSILTNYNDENRRVKIWSSVNSFSHLISFWIYYDITKSPDYSRPGFMCYNKGYLYISYWVLLATSCILLHIFNTNINYNTWDIIFWVVVNYILHVGFLIFQFIKWVFKYEDK